MMLPALRLRSAVEFDSGDQVDFHVHDTVELCFVRRGTTTIQVAGTELRGKPGTLYVLPAKVPHNQSVSSRWRTQCVLFDYERGLFDERPRALDLSGDVLFARWLDDLCDLSNHTRTPENSVADALLFTLLARIRELEAEQHLQAALHPSLALAVTFLEANLKRDVDAVELAHHARASYSHLRALFRGKFGHGPLQHHTALRMRLGQKLLLNPYVRVREVAEELGYVDTNYFVRVFRKTVGLPPAAWRKARGNR